MNNTLSQSHIILTDILEKDVPFGLAVKNVFHGKVVDQTARSNCSALVGCALRHYYLFDELIKRSFGELPARVKTAVILYLANKVFISSVDEKSAFEFMKQKFIDNQVEFDNAKYCALDDSTNDKKKLIPAEYDQKSVEFLSLRFNTPVWLIKMWKKQFSPQLCYPILNANSKSANLTYRVNTFNISTEDFLKENPKFSATEVADMVTYTGEKNLRKETVKNCPHIFEYSLAYKKLFDLVDLDTFRGVAFYIGEETNAFLEMMAQHSTEAKFEIVAKDGDAYFRSKKLLEKYGFENVRTYKASASSIIACISNKVHTFVVLPESSNFASIRVEPDYLLRFKQDSFDAIISAQKEALEEACAFVEDGGNLVYAVPTLNHKEGRAQVLNFLNTHKEFKLVEERQIFPFDKLDSTLYYAVLRKEESVND